MWQLKLASKVGTDSASSALPKGEIFVKYARFIGLGAVMLYVLLGILEMFFDGIKGYILGPILIIIGLGVVALELPFKPLAKFVPALQNYWMRAGAYGLLAIPTWFSIITFVAGLVLVACAVAYALAAFKGQKGKLEQEAVDEENQANQDKKEGIKDKKEHKESIKNESKAETKGKKGKGEKEGKKESKKDKKNASLASQGAEIGES